MRRNWKGGTWLSILHKRYLAFLSSRPAQRLSDLSSLFSELEDRLILNPGEKGDIAKIEWIVEEVAKGDEVQYNVMQSETT